MINQNLFILNVSQNIAYDQKTLLDVISVDEESVKGLYCNSAPSPEACQTLAMPKCNEQAR